MEQMNLFDNKSGLAKILNGRVEPAFGIDLGTTNSAISVIINNNKPEPIVLTSGKKTMPSCVLWNGSKQGFIVGEEAYRRIDEVEHCVYSIKRHMEDPNYTRTFSYGGEEITMTPAEISAEILKALVKQTKGMYGEINDVIVTVPAYFNTTGREATIKACELAGLNLLGLLVEPSAASLTFGLDDGTAKNIMVYDLGGGTFDISLIRLSSTSKNDDDFGDIYGFDDEADEAADTADNDFEMHYKVIDTNGDSHLGGDDCDLALYSIVEERLKEKGVNVELLSDSFKAGMIRRLEMYKKTDIRSSYKINVNTILKDAAKTEINESVMIGPHDFEKSLAPTYKRTVKLLKDLINQYESLYPINDIVLVGGSTKSEIIRENLRRDFTNYRINCNQEPDLSVSLGAAIAAKVNKFGDKNIKIFDALSLAINVREGNTLVPIIPKATELPAVGKKCYTTVVDNQNTINVELYQGNTKIPEEAAYLGNITITGIDPKPAGEPNISVDVSVDVNGVLRCKTVVDSFSRDITLELKSDAHAKTLTREEKRIIKWRNGISEIKDKARREQLEKMLEQYPKYIDAKTIRNAMKEAINLDGWETTLAKLTLEPYKSVLKEMIAEYPNKKSEEEINEYVSEALNKEFNAK